MTKFLTKREVKEMIAEARAAEAAAMRQVKEIQKTAARLRTLIASAQKSGVSAEKKAVTRRR